MKVVKNLVMLSIALSSLGALAGGPNTLDLSCTEAAGLVQSSGAIVLYTGSDIYDRYVASGAYCYQDQKLAPAWVQTADSNACFVGYTCVRNKQ